MSQTRKNSSTAKINEIFHFTQTQRWPLLLTNETEDINIMEWAGDGCGEAAGSWERGITVSLPEGQVKSYEYADFSTSTKVISGEFTKPDNNFHIQVPSNESCREKLSASLKDRLGKKTALVVAAVCSEFDVVTSLKAAGCTVESPINKEKQIHTHNSEESAPTGRCIIS